MKKEAATCINASNFIPEKEESSFYDKLNRFKELIGRNERAVTNSLHISLNVDPSEKLSATERFEKNAIYPKVCSVNIYSKLIVLKL